MKTLKYNTIYTMLLAGCLSLVGVSCDDKEEESLALSRRFRPALVAATNGETQVKLEWLASLFTVPGDVDYVLEVSRDPASFDNPEYTATTKETEIIITDNDLAIKQDYYVRIKAVGASGTEDSRWTVVGPFRILGEQFLLPVAQENIIDRAVRLLWRESTELSKIVITDPAGASVEVSLTDADKTQGFKQIDNLQQSTLYTAEIFAGTKTKGIIQFTTKAGLSGNIIDLRGITGKPSILTDTLPDVASGSVIVLKRGATYTLASSYSFNKSISIVSGLDFGGAQPVIRSSSSFNVVAGSTIDSIVFKDLTIRGGRSTSYASDYLLNANNACVVKKIRLDNCIVKILRGVVRGQASGAGTRFDNYFVNNCVIDSIRDFAVVHANNNSSFGNVRITNSTIYKSRKFIVHGVPGALSVLIENCTFNEAPSNGDTNNYLIDFNAANVTNGITISNCIFGKTWNENGTSQTLGYRAGGSTALNIVNSYATSDFTLTASPLTGVNSYNGTTAALFTDPDTGNFKIKDGNFAGKSSAGDPRWH